MATEDAMAWLGNYVPNEGLKRDDHPYLALQLQWDLQRLHALTIRVPSSHFRAEL